jgi:hypothetical protein
MNQLQKVSLDEVAQQESKQLNRQQGDSPFSRIQAAMPLQALRNSGLPVYEHAVHEVDIQEIRRKSEKAAQADESPALQLGDHLL